MADKFTPKTVITISVSAQHPGKLVMAAGSAMPRTMTKEEILTELGDRL